MPKFEYENVVRSGGYTEWRFTGPEDDKLYVLCVTDKTEGRHAYWVPRAGVQDGVLTDAEEMPLQGDDIRLLDHLAEQAQYQEWAAEHPVMRTMALGMDVIEEYRGISRRALKTAPTRTASLTKSC